MIKPESGVLTLEDGYLCYKPYESRTGGLHRLNSTFWERQKDRWRSDGFSFEHILNTYFDVKNSLLHPVDAEQKNRDRFIVELSVGMIEAIGYVLPRQEKAKPVLIPRDIWENCDLYWAKAEVSGCGFTFTQVRIVVPLCSALLHDKYLHPKPLPELERFAPSEPYVENSFAGSGLRKGKVGRKTLKNDILDAFGQIGKNPNWNNAQLAHEICEKVKENIGKSDNSGLGESAIIKIVGEQWKAFKSGKK